MENDGYSLYVSIAALTLSIFSFCAEVWRQWRDRPRLVFYVRQVTFTGMPKIGEMKMVRVMACNIGYRPLVITGFVGIGKKSGFSMGIDDEPSAIYGHSDQKFPSILEPGESITFHPLTVSALEKNAVDPKDTKVFYDPYRYLALIDSFENFHCMQIEDVRWHLHLDKSRKGKNVLTKLKDYFEKQQIIRKYKKTNR